jgi:hypothetical protein
MLCNLLMEGLEGRLDGRVMALRNPTRLTKQGPIAPSLDWLEPARPLQHLLAAGGDARVAVRAPDQCNKYGCTPFPRPALLDFGSSTASSVSQPAYDRAFAAQARMWLHGTRNGMQHAFDQQVEAARDALRMHLQADGADILFSPSGTDAQLQTLFLVKEILGTPLATIIVGADQTGSGTVHTARGSHFSDLTALGIGVEKGAPIAGLSEQVRTVSIPFYDENSRLRSPEQMDAAVHTAVADARGRGEKVLLQIMDSSKLGWRAPSAFCVDSILANWPDEVRVVVDACQMRIGRKQLRHYLGQGYFVLVTGSKFFAGPAFSGAVLVPEAQSAAIDKIDAGPSGLGDYSTRYDWPRRWPSLRQTLPAAANYGQWLRWEAALEEIGTYFAVPPEFRDGVLAAFAAKASQLIEASPNLVLLADRQDASSAVLAEEMRHRTILSFVAHRHGRPLSLEHSFQLFQALGRDLSRHLPSDASEAEHRIAARICQLGQPLALGDGQGIALRLCASARLVSNCWARSAIVTQALLPVLDDVRSVIEKLDWLIARPALCESMAQ